jgi:hypothetical protein
MWWIKNNEGQDRGGFQNRDVGRTNFSDDFGPSYGTDYAHYSDPPNLARDARVRKAVMMEISKFSNAVMGLEVRVRNGFVIIKGQVNDKDIKELIGEKVSEIPDVVEIVNALSLKN